MFIFRPATLRQALRRHQPALAAGLERIARASSRQKAKVIRTVFPRLPRISFDYAIMEKAEKVAMVPGDFGWADVGSWDMLYRFLGGDGEKNLAAGPLAVLDSKGCYADSRKLVALVGVENLVLVETADAILVMARGREQKLKALIARMEAGGLWKYL
jgi:mannose-1-phosphate guanylyltransferase